jgi:hypothetical protein
MMGWHQVVRTTVDLDDVLLERLRDAAHREGLSFKAMLHRVIVHGLEERTAASPSRFEQRTYRIDAVREGYALVKAH